MTQMLRRNEPLNRKAAAILDSWFENGNAVLFDIETTGLSHRRTQLYLIGAIAEENGSWILRQWFLDDPKEEKELLIAFSSYLRSFFTDPSDPPMLIHFNGDTFDVPYIRNKCSVYGLPDPFDGMINLDIYRKFRPYRKLFGLEKMRQKDLEQCLEISRDDEMSGGELIDVYHGFLRSGNEADLRLLLLHNHDDVTGMAELISALAVPELFDGTLSSEAPEISGDVLNFQLHTHHQLPEVFLRKILPLHVLMARPGSSGKRGTDLPAPEPVSLMLTCTSQPTDECSPDKPAKSSSSALLLHVPLYRGDMLHFFSDYKNYWYFPEQDGVIHKDLAIYASSAHREKACPENCYQRVTGRVFCPQPEDIYTPSCCRSYRSFPSWFVLTENVWDDAEKRSAYIRSLLHQFLSAQDNDSVRHT